VDGRAACQTVEVVDCIPQERGDRGEQQQPNGSPDRPSSPVFPRGCSSSGFGQIRPARRHSRHRFTNCTRDAGRLRILSMRRNCGRQRGAGRAVQPRIAFDSGEQIVSEARHKCEAGHGLGSFKFLRMRIIAEGAVLQFAGGNG
jgi:hypothetical protein